MKTTVKLASDRKIVVEPCGLSRGCITVQFAYGSGEFDLPVHLTQDQAGALIFGLEQAAEAARIAAERQAVAG